MLGGPVYIHPQQVAKAEPWTDRILSILVQTFGNTGTAILIVLIFAFILWTRFRPKV